jgi:hypothetical protein
MGALALASAGPALAAPGGPESPANCTFSGGVTTCASVSQAVASGSTTTIPDVRTGCTTTSTTFTTTTTYTAHHGTYNSRGAATSAPAPTSSSTTSGEAPVCPINGSTPLYHSVSAGTCAVNPAPVGTDQVGTAYWYESGPDVHVHVDFSAGFLTPNDGYYFIARCVYQFGGPYPAPTAIAGPDGSSSYDGTFPNGAGQTIQFDGFDHGDAYFLSPQVTL